MAAHDKRGVTFVDGPHLPYADLAECAKRVLCGLRGYGRLPGDRVLIVADDPQTFLPAFWGCVLGGMVPAPIAPPNDAARWRTQLEQLSVLLGEPLVIAPKAALADLPDVPRLRSAAIEELAESDLGRRGEIHLPQPDDLALLMLTSGSTGLPKAVRLTHANLLAAQAGKAGALGITRHDVFLNWISADHIAAIEAHLLPMTAGADQVIATPQTVLADPLQFLRLVSEHGVTVTFTPNFLFGQLARALSDVPPGAESFELGKVRHIISGGEATVTATVRRFLDLAQPYGLHGDVVVPAFGMTETCAGSVFNTVFDPRDDDAEFPALGRPVRGLEIRIAAPDGHVLAATSGASGATAAAGADGRSEAAGEVQLRGTMVTSGYFGNPQATADAFTHDGWFRTGDLGMFDSSGALVLVGRSKDSVIVNGVNYYSHDLETVLGDLDGVRAGSVAAFPTRPAGADTEQLAVAFAPDGDAAFDDAALYRTIVAIRNSTVMHWGFRPAAILPVDEEAIPRSNLNKIQRSRLREDLERGRLAASARRADELAARYLGAFAEPGTDAERRLAEIYARVLDAEAVSVTTSFFDLGGTSLDVLRLKVEVQRAFGVDDLPMSTILQAPSVRALTGRIAGGAKAEYDPLVPLQLTGDGTPLFCVHPGLGEVLVFINLAKYFTNERPFYALRARGFGEGEAHFGTFAEMVDTYVDAIRRVQPLGPYAVAGYSYGGAVAFEIAKRLEAMGQKVSFVGVFNLPPHIAGRMHEITFTDGALNLALFLDLVNAADIPALAAKLRGLPEDEQLGYLVDNAPRQRLRELDLNVERFAAWVALAQNMVHLGRDYAPSGTVEDVRVFYCTPLKGTKADWLNDQLRAWDDFTRSENRFIEVDGEHYTLMSPEHVRTFQATLRAELRDALASDRRAS
ncbi:alpha/beta fold hydrolase [Actinomadura rupiterrae]|uniref:alpha/beta fold hydrolase n=1 Tax=Actinomadura rupiterrae TaxID=559627 RepID=UPI0020A4655C|nr:non-ribosomal peptide synthetase [Actinomadura rupiterrae]MCP2338101.1 acyl-CoA synthetase (AMP-forming)/AMP-acid ligase II/thioesterase domain-containing protein/acyl carrier protein [Actinomadura rupiterrae]MCP2340762.1 acyl-CoA synthetase (AMP-forming)/AMP-acid ligase II/thioesterase domain-containing protein/acyl carrier protein [Actinomadura rupiterrae]